MLVQRNPGLPNIFDELLRDLSIGTKEISNFKRPAVNIKETETNFSLFVAAPGLSKKDFHIDIEENVLTISAEKEQVKEETPENYTLREYSFDTFKRSFTLPKDMVDTEKISAAYKNGELIISIPKKEIVTKAAKLIEVK